MRSLSGQGLSFTLLLCALSACGDDEDTFDYEVLVCECIVSTESAQEVLAESGIYSEGDQPVFEEETCPTLCGEYGQTYESCEATCDYVFLYCDKNDPDRTPYSHC